MLRRKPPSVNEAVPNLAPMVDVIMVILVFFLLGASLRLTPQGVLRSELDPRSGPGGGAAIEIIPTAKVALVRDEQGGVAVILNGESLGVGAFATLEDVLARRVQAGADPEQPLVITAQPRVRWRHVVAAMDAAAAAGFQNLQFAVALQE